MWLVLQGIKDLFKWEAWPKFTLLLFGGLEIKDSGRVSFADGSSVTAADRKVQGWNSLL